MPRRQHPYFGIFWIFEKISSGDFSVWIGTVPSYSFPTSCTFLVGKGRKRYTTLQTQLYKHFENTREIQKRGFPKLDWNGVFVLFPNILYISCWKREEGEGYTAIQTLRKARKGTLYTSGGWNGTFVLFFPTSGAFLVGRGREGTQLYKHFENTREKLAKRGFFGLGWSFRTISSWKGTTQLRETLEKLGTLCALGTLRKHERIGTVLSY